jgi:hypothetical protein
MHDLSPAGMTVNSRARRLSFGMRRLTKLRHHAMNHLADRAAVDPARFAELILKHRAPFLVERDQSLEAGRILRPIQ